MPLIKKFVWASIIDIWIWGYIGVSSDNISFNLGTSRGNVQRWGQVWDYAKKNVGVDKVSIIEQERILTKMCSCSII